MNIWYRDGSSAQVMYTVIDCDANSRSQRELPVEVSRGGLLTTSAFSGQACLLVSSVEDFGVNQSALIHIKVHSLVSNIVCIVWNSIVHCVSIRHPIIILTITLLFLHQF